MFVYFNGATNNYIGKLVYIFLCYLHILLCVILCFYCVYVVKIKNLNHSPKSEFNIYTCNFHQFKFYFLFASSHMIGW